MPSSEFCAVLPKKTEYQSILSNKLVQKLKGCAKMSENKYLKNTAILFASMAVTKIIGALFKIPLANLLGGTGMGYFSTAYGLYSPIFALTAAAVPTVIMRSTAQNIALGRECRAAAIKRTALALFTVVGLVGTLTVAIFSKPFSQYVACSPDSRLAVLCIAPAVVFCCTASVIRGYYEGLSDVLPSSAASVAESASRAVFGLSLSYAVVFYAKKTFENGADVFGVSCSTAQQAYETALPYAAAGAIAAVSISELFGLVTLVAIDKSHSRKHAVKTVRAEKGTCGSLLREAAPVAACALIMNCVSFVDLLTVSRTIAASAAANAEYYAQRFGEILDLCKSNEGLANFMYGSYSGIAMSIFMLIPSFAGMAEKTALPEIAAAWERRDNDALGENCFTLLRMCSMIGAPACFGAAALAEPILLMLYKSRAAEVSVCLESFVALCFGGLFMITASAFFGIFQAAGKPQVPLVLMAGSVALKLVLNPVLIGIPYLNIAGAAIASSAGYLMMTVGSVVFFRKSFPVKIHLLKAVLPPIACAAACGLTAKIIYEMLKEMADSPIRVFISIFSGAIVYGILLVFGGVFRTSGIIKRKIEKNFQKPLEKNNKIG